MECSACGAPLAPDELACDACGQPIGVEEVAEEDWTELRTELPTEVLATVSGAAQSEADGEPVVALAPPIDHQLVGQSNVSSAINDSTRRGPATRAVFGVGATFGAIVVVAFLAGTFVANGGLNAFFPPPAAITASPAPTASGADPTGSAAPATLEGFGCSPRQLAAAEPGRWELYRAELSSNPQVDHVRLKLHRSGTSDEAAQLTAEIVPREQTGERFGVDPPSDGDVALVLRFSGAVGIGDPFGSRHNFRAVKDLRILRSNDAVHAVLGVKGTGCFSLSGDWAEAGAGNNADLLIEVESR